MHVPTNEPRIGIAFNDTQTHLNVDRERLRVLVRNVLIGERVAAAEVSITLVDDAAIREINRRHLGHDWPTDVITFSLAEPGDRAVDAELVVSAEMAARTAAELQVDPAAELSLYLVHGLLHLCGFDDLTPDDAARMRLREAEVLAREGILNTFSLIEDRALARREATSCSA